jgi:hypothetical protein
MLDGSFVIRVPLASSLPRRLERPTRTRDAKQERKRYATRARASKSRSSTDLVTRSPQYLRFVTDVNFPRDNTYEKPYI